jgi:hypothetical protein
LSEERLKQVIETVVTIIDEVETFVKGIVEE